MDPLIVHALSQEENIHWWFASRRAIARTLLKRLKLPSTPHILDAGCGSGGNLPLLQDFGEIHAFETDEHLREAAKLRAIGHVECGHLPDSIPFGDQAFDLITLFDVLEHIEDDQAALQALCARMKPGGVLFITVPAFGWLYSHHDRMHHHFRRYSRHELMAKIEKADLKMEYIGYWNMWLFPVALVARMLERLRKPKTLASGTQTPPQLLNKILTVLVSSERFIIPNQPLPLGLSLLAIARKSA